MDWMFIVATCIALIATMGWLKTREKVLELLELVEDLKADKKHYFDKVLELVGEVENLEKEKEEQKELISNLYKGGEQDWLYIEGLEMANKGKDKGTKLLAESLANLLLKYGTLNRENEELRKQILTLTKKV